MKKHSKTITSLPVLLAMLCLGYATASFGAPSHGVKYTAHNFGTTQAAIGMGAFYSSNETEICIFCHTPHNAVAGKTFLWNRTNTITTFQMYTASPTLSFTKNNGKTVSTISKMCLTCHDGAGSINAMANPRNINMLGYDQLQDTYYEPGPGWGKNIGETYSLTETYNFDTPEPGTGGVLVNDHPISFIYAESRQNDATIKSEDSGSGGASIGGLPLWYEVLGGTGGYRLECVTCHDPHINYNTAAYAGGNGAYKPFLRKTNYSSSLCFTCHNK